VKCVTCVSSVWLVVKSLSLIEFIQEFLHISAVLSIGVLLPDRLFFYIFLIFNCLCDSLIHHLLTH
jgi:hypothetical protein